MSKPALSCPSCEASLRLTTQPAVGQRIRCPKCHEVFAAPDPNVTEPELVDEEEIEKARPRRQKQSMGVPHVVWYLLAGAVLIGAAAYYKFGVQSSIGGDVKLGVGKDAKDHVEVLNQMQAVHKENSYHYRRIHSVSDAEKRRPRLRELKTELEECRKRLNQLGQITSKEAISLHLQANEAFAQAEDDRQELREKVSGVDHILNNP